jgi:DNA-binding NarL/FixJ family response regulator
MDVRLPDGNGLQVAREIRQRRPETRVIILTTDDSSGAVSQAIEAGVSGYLLKDVGVNDLIHAAKQAMVGKATIHPSLTQAFIDEVSLVDPKPSEAPLSPREIEVLQKVAYGATTREVAEELGISFYAVKKHLEAIFEKLGANARLRAVAEAMEFWKETPSRRPVDEGEPVRFCREHPCCYEVALRDVSDPTAGTWHFHWIPSRRSWRLENEVLGTRIRRRVPKGVLPSTALLGAIPGKRISHIAEGIEKLGLPPGCKSHPRKDRKVLSYPESAPVGLWRRLLRRVLRRNPG